MQIYSLVSQKGGAGKSTLARQLAVLVAETEPSFIIDRDPQRTTTKWWTRRDQIEPSLERPELIDLDGTTLTEATKRLRRKPEGTLFIDTRPAVEEPEAEAALTVVENGLGWVVTPGRADQLAEAIRAASRADDGALARRAVEAAARFDRTNAMNAYAGLVDELLRNPDLAERR